MSELPGPMPTPAEILRADLEGMPDDAAVTVCVDHLRWLLDQYDARGDEIERLRFQGARRGRSGQGRRG